MTTVYLPTPPGESPNAGTPASLDTNGGNREHLIYWTTERKGGGVEFNLAIPTVGVNPTETQPFMDTRREQTRFGEKDRGEPLNLNLM